MGNVTALPTVIQGRVLAAERDFRPAELSLIRRTVASDTSDDEFNLFISYCTALRLDPRRRQIYAFVYSKNDPDKRKMSIVVAIDGFRTIAARSGEYRPDEDEPRYEIDPSLKGPLNPIGLVKAVVRVWKHSHGAWHPVTAVAYWDEYAPLKDEWAKGDDGRRRLTGKKTLEGKWPQMPRLMLAKVAEALALRKAWPDDFSGVYGEEEMERATVEDLTPSEAVAAAAVEDRMSKVSAGRAITIDWLDGSALEAVPVGKFVDHVVGWIENHKDEPSSVGMFRERNRHGLREFWAMQPNDSLEIKRRIETVLAGDGDA